jgi:hypothetical protein
MAVAPIDLTPVDQATAAAIETAEMRAWADCYAAAPADWARRAGLGTRTIGGGLAINWAATGRRYFSRVIGLGVTEPATEESIDEIVKGYDEAGVSRFLLQSMPHCRPAEYEGWLRDRGLEPFDAQDRVYRDGRHAEAPLFGPVERVTRETAGEWAEFLQRVYRLDTGPWLELLIDRPGWHEYVYRDGGEIVAARGMFIGPDGMAWLGMDGPVPGVMTDEYEPDAAICEFMVADGLAHGARSFLADIELHSPELDTPAYRYFGELGFTRPYVRTHWARV